METVSLTCNHCGAPLQVAESTRFATCRHCGSRLAIKHAGGAAYTEVLEELRTTQRAMADDLETIRLQNELERIDREWAEQRSTFAITERDGRSEMPTTGYTIGAVVTGMIMIVLLMLWIANVGPMASGLQLVGYVGIAVVVIMVLRTFHAADRFARAEARHRARRQKVVAQLRGRGTLDRGGRA